MKTSSQFLVIDVSDPGNPSITGSCTVSADGYDIVLIGDFAFVSYTSGGIGIVDIHDPAHPVHLSVYDTPGSAKNMWSVGNLLYVADQTALTILYFDPTALPAAPQSAPAMVEDPLLLRSYPNPFNATATLSFFLDHAGPVELTVFDLQGRRAAALMSGMQNCGEHRVEWNAVGLPSGTYYAQLRAGERTRTIRLMLLK